MGVQQSSKVKSDNHNKPETDYSKEVAAYQRAVYYNGQPSHNYLTQSPSHNNECKMHNDDNKSKHEIFDSINVNILPLFWTVNVNTLSDEEYSNLALNFYLNIYNAIPSAKALFVSIKNDMRTQSRIFFGIFGWLISTINKDNAYRSAIKKLSKLGKMHCKMGITLDYYQKMGGAFHKTMAEHFKDDYSLRVRFCFNALYETVVTIMLAQDFDSKCKSQQKKTMQVIVQTNELENCLNDPHSMEYLELFMKQKLCSELIMFYKDYLQFQSLFAAVAAVADAVDADAERLKLIKLRNRFGERIQTLYINQNAEREVNIGYVARDDFFLKLKLGNNNYCETIYDGVYEEILALIRASVFPLFQQEIKKLITKNTCTSPRPVQLQTNWKYVTDRLNHQTLC